MSEVDSPLAQHMYPHVQEIPVIAPHGRIGLPPAHATTRYGPDDPGATGTALRPHRSPGGRLTHDAGPVQPRPVSPPCRPDRQHRRPARRGRRASEACRPPGRPPGTTHSPLRRTPPRRTPHRRP